VGRWMYERGHIVACEGNLSIRLGRTAFSQLLLKQGMMSPEDLVIMDSGRNLQGARKIYSEAGMHLFV